jgi:metal-dependent amidase/aminoacylase/carboxypeptidase family protein
VQPNRRAGRVGQRGIASHAGAYPHLGRNAADALTIAQVAFGLHRQQLAPSVRVHGIVTEAGMAPNAIPETARGSWYVRADTLAELDAAFARGAGLRRGRRPGGRMRLGADRD